VKAKDASGNISSQSNILTVKTASPAVITPPTDTTTPPTGTPITNGKIVSGYYASWAAYSGFTPLNIDATQLTNIHYAFAKIGDDLKIAIGDPDVDINNFAKLNELKKSYPNLKIIISVGGWEWSGKFSDAALTDSSRIVFADSAIAFMKQYNFDGIDIDWEYPVSGGLSTNARRPEDKTNFTLLMKKLREKLDAQGTADARKYYLSFAGGASNSYISNTELNLLAGCVDYAVIMTYDIHGPWDTYSDFNSPLYTPSEPSPQYKVSIDSVVKAWISAGFPASKAVLGVPFYGYLYTGVASANNGLYSTFTGASSVPYDKIVSTYLSNPAFVKFRHSEAQIPWLFNGSSFISYDDPESIAAKANYVKINNLAGVSVWELSQNKTGTLLKALTDNLK